MRSPPRVSRNSVNSGDRRKVILDVGGDDAPQPGAAAPATRVVAVSVTSVSMPCSRIGPSSSCSVDRAHRRGDRASFHAPARQ
jgi:hypothetical protein